MLRIQKYPRTPHIQGSRLQPGDEDLSQVPFAHLRGRPLVVEEKIDGANAGISFAPGGRLLLQSRGHYLTGGPRERHFAPFKTWAAAHQGALWGRLGSRYVVYGEWLYARHTVFYDALPHYFLEFDVLDTEAGAFLDTPRRRALLAGLPLVSAPVLHEGPLPSRKALTDLIRPALYKTPQWRDRLRAAAEARGQDVARVVRESDPSDLAEGLYIKVEAGGFVTERYKYIRASFHSAVAAAGDHWMERPILPNELAPDADLYAETLP